MATIMSVNVCDSKYNADPTGVRDSTSAIQKAIDDVAAQGGGSVEIPGGMYRVSYPFIEICLLYTSPSPRDLSTSRMPSSA